jgi:hypothetical protein
MSNPNKEEAYAEYRVVQWLTGLVCGWCMVLYTSTYIQEAGTYCSLVEEGTPSTPASVVGCTYVRLRSVVSVSCRSEVHYSALLH